MSQRVAQWQDVIDRATGREPADAGVTLTFGLDPDVAAELARLGAAEHACCLFFTFTLSIGGHGMRFTVTAPPEARHVVAAMFGVSVDGPSAP